MSKPAKSPVSRLMAYVTRRHKAQFSFVVICILASAVASMVGTLFIQVIIDDYILKMLETGEDLFAGLVAVLTVMAAVYLVGALATLFYNRVIAIVGQKVLKEIRDDLFVRMQRLPISYFDSHNHGDIMSVYTNDIDTLRQFIAQSLPMMISSIVTLVFSFAVMLHFSLPLALIVLVISVLMVVVGRLMVRYSGKYFFKQQTSVGYVNGYSEEIFGGLKVVKVFNHEDACREQMRKLNEELYENSLKANGMATVMMPIMSAFGNLEYLIVAVVGGAMALFGDGMFMTTVGTLISFLSLIRQFSSSITQTAQQMNSAVLGVAGAGRIFELMDEEPEADEGYVTLVRAREKGGKIRYDGINITKIKKPDLRRSMGIVLQDVNLFTGTIMENIRYGKLDATDEECIAAAKLSGADSFITRLPQGYDTVINGDSNNLSQGQCQLISIARAAVADPPVMILDEATSSIDTRTEAIVQDGMDRLMEGRTVFVIAHRLSTVRNSKAIMVLEQGRIIERGSHEQLIEEKGQYYQLYTGAFELE